MNAPGPDEHIRLGEGEQKVYYATDTKIADAGTFRFMKEDHTLGNILRHSLLRDERVLFAGYRMPHPLDFSVRLKIKTRPTSDPATVLMDAIDSISTEIESMRDQLTRQLGSSQLSTGAGAGSRSNGVGGFY
jgi:DNA-directed RNA polymerase II subunit RPB11